MHSTRCLRARAENAGCDFEPVVQRNPLVEQEGGGALIALRRFGAPASLLPANEGWACFFCLFHDATLADRRRARCIRLLRHAGLVSVRC